jgi:hypothetical protein
VKFRTLFTLQVFFLFIVVACAPYSSRRKRRKETRLLSEEGTERGSKAHAGKVGTGVLACIAVEQRVEIVHRAHLARPLAWRALVHAAKTGGIAPGAWIRILADVTLFAGLFFNQITERSQWQLRPLLSPFTPIPGV